MCFHGRGSWVSRASTSTSSTAFRSRPCSRSKKPVQRVIDVQSRPHRRLQLRARSLDEAASETDPPGRPSDAGAETRHSENDHRATFVPAGTNISGWITSRSRMTSSRARSVKKRSTEISRDTPQSREPICTVSACRRSAISRTSTRRTTKTLPDYYASMDEGGLPRTSGTG